jgi:hypothetical protein
MMDFRIENTRWLSISAVGHETTINRYFSVSRSCEDVVTTLQKSGSANCRKSYLAESHRSMVSNVAEYHLACRLLLKSQGCQL